MAYQSLSRERVRLETQVLYWCGRRKDAVTLIANVGRVISDIDRDPLVQAILAACLASTGDVKTSLDVLDGAAAAVDDDVACYRASARLAAGDYVRALSELDSINETDRSEMNWFFRGWCLAFQRNIRSQLDCLYVGLQLASDRGNCIIAARTLRVLAALARETVDTDAIACVEGYDDIQWTHDLADERFSVLRTTAWAHAMRGQHLLAGEELAEAFSIAATPYQQMLVHLDRAWIAAASREGVHQRIELGEARRCARSIEWDAVKGEEVGGLLLLARLMSDVDVDLAIGYLDQADKVAVPAHISFAHDERLRAFRDEAAAFVCAARHSRRKAERHATAAIVIFERYGYRWRAANLALLLFRLSGGQQWLQRAKADAETFPRSFLGVEYKRLATLGRNVPERLTRRQNEIVTLIKDEGLATEAIAARLSMSPNTVRIHKQRIYRAFAVTGEYQLLAKLREDGL